MLGSTQFLKRMFGTKNEKDYLLIWTLPDKKSYWFQDIDDADKHIKSIPEKHDIYFGLGVTKEDFGVHRRGKVEDIVGIPGLWADIDFANDVHAQKRLPADDKIAIKIIDKAVPPPTIIINSGHGWQCYWLFKEFWTFENDDREKAIELSTKWSNKLRQTAHDLGYEIDSVPDLSRVFRVPGTVNYKSTPIRVEFRNVREGAVYEPTDCFNIVSDVSMVKSSASVSTISGLVLNPSSVPPFDKFNALCDAEPKFKKSWERKRKDMQDDSPSGYDYSLASYALKCKWSDQEIVDLLIASRRKHNDDLKLREYYYARTIGRVKQSLNENKAVEIIDEINANVEDPIEQRKVKIEHLSSIFSIKITKLIKYRSEDSVYRLCTPTQNITLGDISNVIEQYRFRKKIADVTDKIIPRFKTARWDKIAQTLLDICETVDDHSESKSENMASDWIHAYFDENPPAENVDEAITTRRPFFKNNDTFFFGSDFRKWLAFEMNERISSKQMGIVLRTYGCRCEIININVNKTTTTRSVWRVISTR